MTPGGRAPPGRPAPILYLDSNGQPSQIRLTDVGDPATFGSAWLPSTDANRHVSLYAQDRWVMSSRVTVTGGVRYDQQRPYYESSTARTGARRYLPGSDHARTHIIRPQQRGAARRHQRGPDRREHVGRESVLGPLLPQPLDVRQRESWRHQHQNVSLRRSERQPTVRRQARNSAPWSPRAAARPPRSTRRSKTPHTDEVDVSYQRQLASESSARIAYVRKMTRDQIATLNAAWVGQFTSPLTTAGDAPQLRRRRRRDRDVHGVRHPGGAARSRGQRYRERAGLRRRAARPTTTPSSSPSTCGWVRSFYLDSGVDMTWKDDLRSPANTSNSPLTQADPIAAAYFENVYPSVSARQRSSVWEAHARRAGTNCRMASAWAPTSACRAAGITRV